jgi:predicted nucleic acid-binding protein
MPTGKQQIIYWDTCVFLAWMKDEERGPGEMEALAKVAKLVQQDKVILVTSMLTRAEILESKLNPGVIEKYDLLTRRTNVVPQSLDLPVAKLTSKIRDFYVRTDFELLTPDAIHLATAVHYHADEFHTFDGSKKKVPRDKRYKRCGLLLLDGSVAGHALKVCKPTADQYELRLKPEAESGEVAHEVATGENAENHQLEANPTHPAPVQGSDSGRAQGEAAGETTGEKNKTKKIEG